MHSEHSDAPVSEYVPASQLEQEGSPSAEYVPAGQSLQVDALGGAYVPGEHDKHMDSCFMRAQSQFITQHALDACRCMIFAANKSTGTVWMWLNCPRRSCKPITTAKARFSRR